MTFVEERGLCNAACIAFAKAHLSRSHVHCKHVIEIGAMNVNGSIRQSVAALGPASYLGIDIAPGPGVDEVCNVARLVARYGRDRFDVVICTEVLEHVRDWRGAVYNMKSVLRPGGVLLVTTRSRGFPYHGYPLDFWRFELSDFKVMFGDLEMEVLEQDPEMPGVFLRARKTATFTPGNLATLELWSIVNRRRCREVSALEIAGLKLRHRSRDVLSRVVPEAIKDSLRKVYPGI